MKSALDDTRDRLPSRGYGDFAAATRRAYLRGAGLRGAGLRGALLSMAGLVLLGGSLLGSEQAQAERRTKPRSSKAAVLDATPTALPAPPAVRQPFGSPPPVGLFSARSSSGLTGRLAFTVELPDTRALYTLDLDTSSLHFMGINGRRCGSPAWSPDGSKIATSCEEAGGVQELYLISTQDGAVRPLTALQRKSDEPNWSMDGSSVLFTVRSLSAQHSEIYSVAISPPDAKPVRLTTFGSGLANSPAWFDDGQSVLFGTDRHWPGWDVCTVQAKSKAESCITQGSESIVLPQLSHGKTQLLIGLPENSAVRWEIMDLRARSRNRLTDAPGVVRSPTWSRDDNCIAVITTPPQGDQTISVINLKDKSIRVVLTSAHPLRGLDWWGEQTKGEE